MQAFLLRIRSVSSGMLSWLGAFMRAIWLLFPSLSIVALIFYVLLAQDMAYDTLMMAGENSWQFLLTLLALIFWSAVVWFSSRILTEVYRNAHSVGKEENLLLGVLPRFLALNCFIALQTAILSLHTINTLDTFCILLFILFQYIMYFLAEYSSRNNKKAWWLFTQFLGLVYISCLIGLIVANCRADEEHVRILPRMCLAIYLLQVFSMLVYSKRRKYIDNIIKGYEDNTASRHNSIIALHQKILQWLGVNNDTAKAEALFYVTFHALCLVVVACFISCIISYTTAVSFGPLSFTIIALSIIIILFQLFSALSLRLKVNVTVIFWAALIILACANQNHYKLTELSESVGYEPLTPAQFLTKWCTDKARVQEINAADSTNPYHAFVVLSDGGGARAATWSASMLAQLHDRTSGNFSKHLFALGGASGGSVGNCAFYGLLQQQPHSDSLFSYASEFFRADFLTYTLAHLLGPDLLHSYPTNRASALASTFENNPRNASVARAFTEPCSRFFDTSGHLPALFLNVTNTSTGLTNYFGNVTLLKDSLRTNQLFSLGQRKRTIKVSQAAVLSASFPFVSPAGGLGNSYFVDGGYVDNSGAATMLSFLREVYDTLHKSPWKNKIRFTVIELHNGELKTVDSNHINPFINDFFSPLVALISMQNGSTRSGNYLLNRYMQQMDSSFISIPVNLYASNDSIGYPLSWTHSQYNFNRIIRAVHSSSALQKINHVLKQ